MRKILLALFAILLLSNVCLAAGTAQFTLGITIREMLAIEISPMTLAFTIALNSSANLCGDPTNPEGGVQPCPTISNVGVDPWKLTVRFHDDGPFIYLKDWGIANQDEVTLGLAVSSTGSIQEAWPKTEDVLHTSPWGTVSGEGVNVPAGGTLRLWLKWKGPITSSVLGVAQSVVLTFGCVA